MDRTTVTKQIPDQNIELMARPFIVDPVVARQYKWYPTIYIIMRPFKMKHLTIPIALDSDTADKWLDFMYKYQTKWFGFCIFRAD